MKTRLGLKAELPVADLISEAVQLLWRKRNDVIRMFLPAIVLLAAVDWASQYFFPPTANEGLPSFHPEQLLFVVFSIVLSVLLATACHRFTLLPKEQWNTNALHLWKTEELRYLMRGIHIAIICVPIFFAVMFVLMMIIGQEQGMVAGAAGFMVMLYVWSRLSITLPEIALGQRTDLSHAWKLSQGNGSRLVVVVWVVPVLMAAPFWATFMIEDELGILNYLAAFGIYLTTLISLVMLSLSYRFLMDFYESNDESTASTNEPETSRIDERQDDKGSFDA